MRKSSLHRPNYPTMLRPPDRCDRYARSRAYAAGHMPGAVNIHDIFTYLATSTPEGVAAMRNKFAEIFGAAGLSGEETAVVYEQSMNTGFGQSCRGYVLLRYLGYPKVKILHGGYAAWSAAGLPTTTEVPTPEPTSSPSIRKPPACWSICRHEGRGRRSKHRQARHPRRRRMDRRKLLALRQGFLPAQGPHTRRRMDRVVPHDEADTGRADVQVARRKFSPNARPSASRRRRRSSSTASRARAPPTLWSR